MNNSIEAEIFLRKEISFVYKIVLLVMILIVCMTFIILNINYQTVLNLDAMVKRVNNIYLVMMQVSADDIKYIINNNKIKIDDDEFYYEVYKIDKELYMSDNMKNYKVVYLRLNLDKKYQVDNLAVSVKVNKENKMIFEYLKNYIMNGGWFMNLVQEEDMHEVVGGSATVFGLVFAGIALGVTFVIGIVDGYLNPNLCNMESDSQW
mgnify:CR=1 FL=1